MTGKLTLRGLPHLPGVPHLHVNTPLNFYCWCNLCWKVPWVPETFHARSLRVTCFATHDFGLRAKTPHARKDLWNLYKILRNCPPTPPFNQSSHKFLVTWLQTLSPFLACLPPNPPPPPSRTPSSLSNISKNLIELVQSTSLAIRIGKNNSTFKYQTFCTYICLQLITVINALLQLYLLTPIYKHAVAGSIHMTLSMDLSFSCEYFKATVTTDTY